MKSQRMSVIKREAIGAVVASRVAAVLVVVVGLAGCAAPEKPPTAVLGESVRSAPPKPVVDADINGSWTVKSADLSGKKFDLPAGFELRIEGDRYATGVSGSYNDRGRIVLFGDELAGQARRLDVVGEVGMNKGKRFPALYRMVGRDLEIVYDLAGMTRPTDFVSREGTMWFRVTYQRKST
jgi:uncharacterized protein (TIGR03067 family)